MKLMFVILLTTVPLFAGCATLNVERTVAPDGTTTIRVTESGAPLLTRKSNVEVAFSKSSDGDDGTDDITIKRTTDENADKQADVMNTLAGALVDIVKTGGVVPVPNPVE